MKVKCCSVRLESLVAISDKAYKATCFDGREDIVPASQVYGRDLEVQKSDAWWISEWILEKKNLQYSDKKTAWFDSDSRHKLPSFIVKKHFANKKTPVESNEISSLKSE